MFHVKQKTPPRHVSRETKSPRKTFLFHVEHLFLQSFTVGAFSLCQTRGDIHEEWIHFDGFELEHAFPRRQQYAMYTLRTKALIHPILEYRFSPRQAPLDPPHLHGNKPAADFYERHTELVQNVQSSHGAADHAIKGVTKCRLLCQILRATANGGNRKT